MSGYTDLSFRAMGCQSRVIVNGADHAGLAAAAIERIEELESLWSRFRPDSEVSELNRNRGRLVTVSPDTYTLVAHAIEAWRLTSGRFDPTLLDELVAHGYDRDHHDLVPPEAAQPELADDGLPTVPRGPSSAAPAPGSPVEAIGLLPELGGIVMPDGASFDPGGIGKGLAADLVAAEIMDRGAAGVLVDLGGDLRIRGDHPDLGPVWSVDVESGVPGPAERFSVGISDGGVATSSQLTRRWSTGSGDRHHLLDPRSGCPSTSRVAVAVVASGTAWQAEVIAKAALLAGVADGCRLVAELGGVGVLIDLDGQPHDAGLMAAAGLGA